MSSRQLFLPGLPEGMKTIGKGVGILEKGGQATYLVGNDNCLSQPCGCGGG